MNRIAIACSLLLLLPLAAKAQPPLELHSMRIGEQTIHIDRDLLGEREAVIQLVEQRAAEARQARELLSRRKPEILAAIDELFGGPAKELPMEVWYDAWSRVVLGPFGLSEEIYIILKSNAKAHLRAGGQLPGMEYDRATDRVSAQWSTSSHMPAGSTEPVHGSPPRQCVLPVDSVQDLAELKMPSAGVLIHELVEGRLLLELKPRGPHWRWFSDGFADALAVSILRRLGEANAAQAMHAATDPQKYLELRSELNLAYWLAAGFEPEAPPSRRLSSARYAWSYHEANRLLEEHGEAIFTRIMQEARAMERPTGPDLVRAIERATGQPFTPRLQAYQSFATAEEGAQLYSNRYAAALQAGEHEAALEALVRLMEIRFAASMVPAFYTRIADLLLTMNEPAQAVAVLRGVIQLSQKSNQNPTEWEDAVMRVACTAQNPALAYEAAAEALKRRPEAPAPMVVDLHRRIIGGDAAALDAVRALRQAGIGQLDPAVRAVLEQLVKTEP